MGSSAPFVSRLFVTALLAVISLQVAAAPQAHAQDCFANSDPWVSLAGCTPAESAGGGWCAALHSSPYLTGDWCGARTGLGAHGIAFNADVTQFYMGVVDGGVERKDRYGGHGDYVLNVDGQKAGLWQGLFIKLRAEHRFGQSPGADTGAFLPPAVAADLPVIDSEQLYLTNVLFTQALSESFAVFAGKLDTLDGDMNAFAHGRGKTQFSNMAFIANPIALRTIPYSTLGFGFVILRDMQPLFTFSVLNPTDTTRTSGFEEFFEDGVAMSAELRVPVTLFDLPGHQLVGATVNTRDFATFGQDPRIILPGIPIAKQSGSWSLYWNCDQHLYVDANDPARGWGVFGRAGVADDMTNPLSYFLSGGVGGSSLLPRRKADTFGIGWYYTGTSDEIGPLLTAVLGPLGNGQGVEAFYNAEVTPWFHVTPDVQVIMPARETVETAVLAGVRAKVDF